MRILVTGSRNLYPAMEARKILAQAVVDVWPEDIVVVHGACPLKDSVDWAFDWAAKSLNLDLDVFFPHHFGEWPGCGPLRNEAMVAFGADLGIAYHDNLEGSKGTLGCVRLMLQARIPVLLFDGSGGPGQTILRLEGNRPIMRIPHDGD